MGRIEPERSVLQLVTERERLLREGPCVGEATRLTIVLGGVNRNQPEPARIANGAGHGLGFLQVAKHFLEVAQRIEWATELYTHIDLLLPRLRRRRQMTQGLKRLFQSGQRLAVG